MYGYQYEMIYFICVSEKNIKPECVIFFFPKITFQSEQLKGKIKSQIPEEKNFRKGEREEEGESENEPSHRGRERCESTKKKKIILQSDQPCIKFNDIHL